MMPYGILIAVSVPVLAGKFYGSPPDADTASATVSLDRCRPVAGLAPNPMLAILATRYY